MANQQQSQEDPSLIPCTVGKVYLLRGGHVLRYQGRIGGCLVFRGVRHGVSEPLAGHYASADDVLREVSDVDCYWLSYRRDQARARNLPEEVADMDFLLRELGSG